MRESPITWGIVDFSNLQHEIQVEKWVDPRSGPSTGSIKHPDSLLRAVHTLVRRTKVNAVAVVGRFPDDDVEDMADYRKGKVRKLYS